MKLTNHIAAAALSLLALGSCTNLDEILYDQVGSENYYNTKMDVIRATFRPFEHAFWSIGSRQVLNELTADQLITPTRDGWWYDGGKWERLHYHTWTVDDLGEAQTEWNGCFQGIMQCNLVIEDLRVNSPAFRLQQCRVRQSQGPVPRPARMVLPATPRRIPQCPARHHLQRHAQQSPGGTHSTV